MTSREEMETEIIVVRINGSCSSEKKRKSLLKFSFCVSWSRVRRNHGKTNNGNSVVI